MAVLIVIALAAGVASDLAPSSPGYAVGAVAAAPILAPRDATFPNPEETKTAQDLAAQAVTPVYDYTVERAASIAATQVAELQAELKPIDDAFLSTTVPDAQRAAVQAAVASLSSLSADNRTILLALSQDRWLVVEQAAESALHGPGQASGRNRAAPGELLAGLRHSHQEARRFGLPDFARRVEGAQAIGLRRSLLPV